MTEKGMGIVIHLTDLLVLLRMHQIFDSNYTVQYTLLFYIIFVFFFFCIVYNSIPNVYLHIRKYKLNIVIGTTNLTWQ